MQQFVDCQFTFEDLRDCSLLLDDKNPKHCDICKKHIGLHKKKYIETSLNPGSYYSTENSNSYESSIRQHIICEVPNPISSSMTVASSSHGFDAPGEKFSPEDAFKEKDTGLEISDLEDDRGNALGMDFVTTDLIDTSASSSFFFSSTDYHPSIYDYSTQILDATDALLSLPRSGCSSSSSLPVAGDSKTLASACQRTAEYYQSTKGSCKGFSCQDAIKDPLDLRWMPSVDVDLRLFDLSLLAPQQRFFGNRFGTITYEYEKVTINEEAKEATFAPFDEIIAVVTGFEYTVWPVMKQGCYNTYVQRNASNGYMYCKTACGAMSPPNGPIKNCRFWIGFKKETEKHTGESYGVLTKCFLTHDCRTSVNIEYDLAHGIKHKYRKRNPKLKYLVPSSVFLSCFYKQPDLTKNTGTTAMQIRRSVENENTCIPISKAQSFSFLSSKNHNSWEVHTKEYTQLPDFFLKMQECDPEGLYILEFLPVAYELPGVSKTISDTLLMFNYSICIPSACKHFYEHGMKICVVDGAHMYTRTEGIMLSFCTKDGEDHIVTIGFALVPRENKHYWQLFMNAVFFYISRHDMIMSDKTKGLEGIRDLIVKVAADMKAKNTVGSEDVTGTVYALCVLHGSRNAKITNSNMTSLVVQWAKCGNDEDAGLKEDQMQKTKPPISAFSLNHLHDIQKDVTYLGLHHTQNLETNYEVVTSNIVEQKQSSNKDIRSSPIVEIHFTFLEKTASTFSLRHLQAQSYQSNKQLSVVPLVLQKTIEGAEYLSKRGWTVYVAHTHSPNGSPGSALSVEFMCRNNNIRTPQSYTVILTCSTTQPWYKNIICKCNRTRQYGRPCYHASLCLRQPPFSDPNMIARDPQSFDIARPIWYSDKFLVSTMIRQYSAQVKMPSFRHLKQYRIFPPIIYKLPGRPRLKRRRVRIKKVCYICNKYGHRADKCPAKDTGKILEHRGLIKPLLTLDTLDPDQIFALRNKAPEISEEMLRVPDYFDDIDELSDEDDADEDDECADEEIIKEGSSSKQTKKRTWSQSNADADESSSESEESDV